MVPLSERRYCLSAIEILEVKRGSGSRRLERPGKNGRP
jgi:hypothetical protein